MSMDTIYRSPADVLGVTDIHNALIERGVAYFQIDEGAGPKRVIIGLLPTYEIMVGMEGGGCVFLTENSIPNPFTLITDGFQLRAANIIVVILGGLVRSFAPRAGSIQPQLEDKRS